MKTFFVFINNDIKMILAKTLMLRIDVAASGGDQGKLRHFMSFLFPPLEAVVLISTLYFLFISNGRLLFPMYRFFTCSVNLQKKLPSIKTVESKVANIY